MIRWRFAIGVLLFILAAILQLRLLSNSGWSPQVVLATLIALSFFLNLGEFLLLLTFAVWTMNWQPAASPEIWALALVPLAAFYIRRFLPWQSWLNNLILLLSGIGIFYLSAQPVLTISPRQFLPDLGFSLLAGVAVFSLLRYYLGYRTRVRRI